MTTSLVTRCANTKLVYAGVDRTLRPSQRDRQEGHRLGSEESDQNWKCLWVLLPEKRERVSEEGVGE